MELYKITTSAAVLDGLTWDRVCTILINSDVSVWDAHDGLEDSGRFPFIHHNSAACVLERA